MRRCAACKSTWFREAVFHSCAADLYDSGFREYRKDWGQSAMGMGVLVCVCGAPNPPALSGVRGGRTPNLELARFQEDFERLAEDLAEHQTAETVEDFAARRFAAPEALGTIPERLKKLEKAVGGMLAARDPARATLVGRHWKPPQRRPRPERGRDWLAWELQKRGFAFRQVHKIVHAIFKAMAEALRRGEDVETPLGTFEVVYGPREQTRVRFGKTQTLFRNYKRVRFRPDPQWKRALAPPGQKKHTPDPQEEKTEKKAGLLMSSLLQGPLVKCPHCGGTWFTQQEFRQYRAGVYSSLPGGDISPVSKDADVIRALVCLCGYVRLTPRNMSQSKTAYELVAASLKEAQRRRDSHAEELLATLEGRFASAERLQRFLERLEADETAIKQLKK